MVGDDGVYKGIPMDRNNTMEKFLAGLEQYVGANVKEEVYMEALNNR